MKVKAYFAYKKNGGFIKEFEGYTQDEIRREIAIYVKEDNVGEPKSERIRFLKFEIITA